MDNIEKDIAQGYADFADDEGSIEEVETEENIVTENSTSFSFEETTNFSEMSDINRKLRTYFDGKIVRKDLTKSIKEGANGTEIKTYDKVRALELLGKHLGVFDSNNGVAAEQENNIFDVIDQSTREELDTSAISEIEHPAKPGNDLVE